jgi:nucleotide-binding universal stress UspA family protein
MEGEERGETSIAEAKLLATEHGVDVEGVVVRGRAIGRAVVEEARARGVDLIMMGSSSRWRRRSGLFGPTVEYVLKNAPCEVMVIAFPSGVLEEEDREALAAGGGTLFA